jgi:RNA polymerase sigma factor (sigma-70 family)
VPGIAVLHRGTTTPDGVLVQEAAAGSGVSYGVLYDRYATQVYNYSLRLTGSPEDASDATQEAFVNVLRRLQEDDRPVLEFSSYLFAAARHESYGLMRQRARTHPTDTPPAERGRVADLDTDPERSVLLHDSQEAVRDASAQLPPRHREVLALREVAGRSYEEIGATMGISENAAAQLIFRARSKLREAMTAGAVASVVATTDECETAQILLSRVQDGQPVEEEDRAWLEKHLDECGSCKTANRMLLEIGASYRLWGPVALLAGMRTETLARAGDLVGADWSHVPAPGKGSAASSAGGAGGTSAAAGAIAAVTAAVVAVAGLGAVTLLRDDESAPVDRAAKAAASASAPAAKSASASKSDAKEASTGGKLVASRASGSRGTPALVALPADLPALPFDEAAAPDTGNAPPDSGSPQDRPGQERPGQDSPGQPEDGPGQPPGDGPGSDTPAPPGPPVLPGPGVEPPAPVDSVPADPVRPVPDPVDTTDPTDPGNPSDPTDPTDTTDPTDPVDQVPDTQCSFPGRGTGPDECPPGHVGDTPGDGTRPPGDANNGEQRPRGLLQRLLHRLLG